VGRWQGRSPAGCRHAAQRLGGSPRLRFRTKGARAAEGVGGALAGPLARRLPPCGSAVGRKPNGCVSHRRCARCRVCWRVRCQVRWPAGCRRAASGCQNIRQPIIALRRLHSNSQRNPKTSDPSGRAAGLLPKQHDQVALFFSMSLRRANAESRPTGSRWPLLVTGFSGNGNSWILPVPMSQGPNDL